MLDAKGNPYFIDFQGGRKGPYYYDLAFILGGLRLSIHSSCVVLWSMNEYDSLKIIPKFLLPVILWRS